MEIGRLYIGADFFPPDLLLGLATGRGGTYCEDCDVVHPFYAVQLGFFFFVVNFLWYY